MLPYDPVQVPIHCWFLRRELTNRQNLEGVGFKAGSQA